METYAFTNAGIGQAIETIEEYLDGMAKLPKKDAMRISLTLEEALLRYQDTMPEGSFKMGISRRWGRQRIELQIAGACLNPFEQSTEGEASLPMRETMAQLGMAPDWHYRNGTNLIQIHCQAKGSSPIVKIGMAILLAVLVGLVMKLLPESYSDVLLDDLLNPVFNTFLGTLSAIAGPMIFLSIIYGISNMGDVATVSHIGKTSVAWFLSMLAVLTFAVTGVCALLFPSTSGTVGGESMIGDMIQMVLNIVPSDIITPFQTGNSLQIVFLGAVMGLTCLILGQKVSLATQILGQLNDMIMLITETVSRLVPAYIFVTILNLFLNGQFNAFAPRGVELLAMMVVACLAVALILVVFTGLRYRMNLVALIKKLAPTFLLAFLTASSSAAFATNLETCEKNLGINRRMAYFGVPVGQILFKPASAAMRCCAAIFFARAYGVAMTPGWILMVVILVTILAVATPPIPGGGVATYSIFFTQLGIPMEAMGLMVTVDAMADFVITAVNITGLQCVLTLVAGHMQMVDEKVLKA